MESRQKRDARNKGKPKDIWAIRIHLQNAHNDLAIDHGIFYNEEFESFVLEKIGGFGCEAVLVEPGKRQTSAPGIRHPGGEDKNNE
jgi:hypothetical protein